MTIHKGDLHLANYVVAFVDLLGQRNEMVGCGLLPTDRSQALATAQRSVGRVKRVHSFVESMYDEMKGPPDVSRVPQPLRDEFREAMRTELRFQRFSDGLVAYACLEEVKDVVPLNGVLGLLTTCGALCLMSLAEQNPIRAGIELAWAAEENGKELYGCALAKAYKLESEVAKYPRVVVGEELLGYLQWHAARKEMDRATQLCVSVAKDCLSLVSKDDDGVYIVDYLGVGFRGRTEAHIERDLHTAALTFARAQLGLWKTNQNNELTNRYQRLLSYFSKSGLTS